MIEDVRQNRPEQAREKKSPLPTWKLLVNDCEYTLAERPATRLSEVLRNHLHLTGTKTGCDAGDCGACTILLDGLQVCSCMLTVAQAEGHAINTVEGLAGDAGLSDLQNAFLRHGAAQCGICTPGMLMAASDLLSRVTKPTRREIMDAMGGVLCRCTGYLKIVDAVQSVAEGQVQNRQFATADQPEPGAAVGFRLPKVDGVAKLTGTEIFAADRAPVDALWLRTIRSPYARAQFRLSDPAFLYARYPGLKKILTAADIPGNNGFGIYPDLKDQPVLAIDQVRFQGEAVLALIGDKDTVYTIADQELPIEWQVEPAVSGVDAAVQTAARQVQENRPGNLLTRGWLEKGDVEAQFAQAQVVVDGEWQTPFVEHAYIEPEAGFAHRVGERLEIFVTTQAPYMDRDETAQVLGLKPEQIRIIPSACGGGFGGKLDLSVQALLGLAAWILREPVRCVYSRPESMAATTKRHPALIKARAACSRDGLLTAFQFDGAFDTGAYASWGPTVADRVPVHCTGPYVVPHVQAHSRAILTNAPPAGAFRGFGVPQAAIAHEALMDMMAEKINMDALEFRLRNAIRAGQKTATGQILHASAGLSECLQAVAPRWRQWLHEAVLFNADDDAVMRRGVGVGCMWYGCGNTSMSNPSTMRLGIDRDGIITLYSGAVDIGQGANTILVQIAADALGVAAQDIRYIMGDTDLTADAGKSSASRQTFVSGKAVQEAGEALRAQILRLTNASQSARIRVVNGIIEVSDNGYQHIVDLSTLPDGPDGDALSGHGYFDPPTGKLNEQGQGTPYATYGFAAQVALVEVDTELGTVKVLSMAAAHDVGNAVNPTQIEGQIHGGIAQGLGLALMEEYIPGRTENLHDYLIPTFGDMPEVEVFIIEDEEPLGPYGAKGIGEPALVATAPAILGAIYRATGVRINAVPATPDRVRAALLNKKI